MITKIDEVECQYPLDQACVKSWNMFSYNCIADIKAGLSSTRAS